jgi:hypothetical protein
MMLAIRRPLGPAWSIISYTALAVAVSVLLVLVVANARMDQETLSFQPEAEEFLEPDRAATEEFVSHLDIREIERNGSDFSNPKFSPLRMGIPLEKLDVAVDYDFPAVAEAERRLKGVDRRTALRQLFATITEGARTNTEKHLALLRFLHKSSFHNAVIPLHPDRTMVMDPLVTLHLGEMGCGYVSRLAVDLFDSGGIKGHLVQLGGHVIAEFYYDNGWHYFDGDIFGNGETVVTKDGTIPSVAELSREPYRIDALSHYRELTYTGGPRKGSVTYPSWSYFSKDAYGPGKGFSAFYEKTASEVQERNRYYGWNYLASKGDSARLLHKMKPFSEPGAVTFMQVEVGRNDAGAATVRISWSAAIDSDNDLMGYKVFVSRKSRGWAYGRYTGPAHLKAFVIGSGGWKPDMYEKLYRLPLHEVRLLKTKHTFSDLALPPGATYFITVMPYDAHGEVVGRILYQMSDEIQVNL